MFMPRRERNPGGGSDLDYSECETIAFVLRNPLIGNRRWNFNLGLMNPPYTNLMYTRGFTLIELSIVLVIIGLIVGGILVGRDLINSAAIKSQVSQLQQFDTAVNTFRDKYGALPGDIGPAAAAQFGFVARSGIPGSGDNNGVIEGQCYGCPTPTYGWDEDGEPLFFWEDLSAAKLIKGTFNTATDADVGVVTSNFGRYFPPAQIGNGNYVYVYSTNPGCPGCSQNTTTNYYGISIPVSISASGNLISSAGMSVMQAHDVDQKIDDGFPVTGRIVAQYSIGGGQAIQNAANAAADSAATCYNNSTNAYSVNISGGANVTCGLSFRFQ
jgi:prepilin-type N-terminal cleavage/methylation domain-containing protein